MVLWLISGLQTKLIRFFAEAPGNFPWAVTAVCLVYFFLEHSATACCRAIGRGDATCTTVDMHVPDARKPRRKPHFEKNWWWRASGIEHRPSLWDCI